MPLTNFNVSRCKRGRFGWRCARDYNHRGICALVPVWYNVIENYRWAQRMWPL